MGSGPPGDCRCSRGRVSCPDACARPSCRAFRGSRRRSTVRGVVILTSVMVATV